MPTPDEQKVLQRLQRLSEIEPSAESTRRAVERVRVALSKQPFHKPLLKRRMVMSAKVAVAVAIAAGIAGIVTWLMPATTGANVAFADVQEKMRSVQTVTFKEAMRTDGQAMEISHLMISGDRLRAEMPNGAFSLVDSAARKSMALSPKEKKALVFEGFAFPQTATNFYDTLRTIHQDATKRLPDREIDGQKVIGFLVRVEGVEMRVWVDPETQLPVQIEGFEGDDEEPRVLMREFVFGGELDESLFDMTIPKGYEVTSYGVPNLQPPLDAESESALVVTPLVGIGPAKFGMSKEEVVKALGEPDKVLKYGTAGRTLEYYSRGFGVSVSSSRGMLSVTCYSQKTFAVQVRDFKGKTDKGIRLGAIKADIVKTYGQFDEEHIARFKDVFGEKTDKPNEKTGQSTLSYYPLRLDFALLHDQLYQIHFSAPRVKRGP